MGNAEILGIELAFGALVMHLIETKKLDRKAMEATFASVDERLQQHLSGSKSREDSNFIGKSLSVFRGLVAACGAPEIRTDPVARHLRIVVDNQDPKES